MDSGFGTEFLQVPSYTESSYFRVKHTFKQIGDHIASIFIEHKRYHNLHNNVPLHLGHNKMQIA